jgi:hypothetical protein
MIWNKQGEKNSGVLSRKKKFFFFLCTGLAAVGHGILPQAGVYHSLILLFGKKKKISNKPRKTFPKISISHIHTRFHIPFHSNNHPN